MNRRPLTAVLAAASIAGFSLYSVSASAGNDIATAGKASAATDLRNMNWSLRLPPEGHVAYHGSVSFDEAGTGTMSFMYPAPNAGGLIAAVLTHGLLVETAKTEQKEKFQAAADKVLLPYKGVVDNFRYQDLMRRALAKASSGPKGRLIEASSNRGTEMLVESVPVFSLTQDQKAIVLENDVGFSTHDTMPEKAYRNTIRVVSAIQDTVDPVTYWTSNDGEKLKDESAQLVAESLDIAFGDAARETNREEIPYRTIRYQEGTVEKIERAQILRNQCGRMVIRTLRGTVMSVPTSTMAAIDATSVQCGPRTGASAK